MGDEFWLHSSLRKVELPSPKWSTKIPVAFSDLFFKPRIYLGPEVISIWDTTRLFSNRLFLSFLWLSDVRTWKIFILLRLLIIEIVIIIFLLVEKEILVLVCKATLEERKVTVEIGLTMIAASKNTYKQSVVDLVSLIQLRDYWAETIFHCHLHSEDSQWGLTWTHNTVPKLDSEGELEHCKGMYENKRNAPLAERHSWHLTRYAVQWP